MEKFNIEQYNILCKQTSDNINDMYRLVCDNKYSRDVTKYSSGLDAMDYAYAIILGMLGAYVTSSKNVQVILDKVHQIASTKARQGDNKFELLIKMLLGHNGDFMDTMPVVGKDGEISRKFISRTKDATISGPHRVFWGHDILSLKKDNPFYLMEQQVKDVAHQSGKSYVPGKGIIQALKHLTADTFSKQGLPIPTVSWWDYTYTDKKGAVKQGNKLLDLCNRIYKEVNSDKISVSGSNNDIFNHMFSIHFQDIAVQKTASILCEQYIKCKKIEDIVIQHQFKLICYSVLFWMNCVIGGIKYSIPYINWASGVMVTKEFCMLIHDDYADIRQLEKETNRIVKETMKLEEMVKGSGDKIQVRTPVEMYQQYESASKRLNRWL